MLPKATKKGRFLLCARNTTFPRLKRTSPLTPKPKMNPTIAKRKPRVQNYTILAIRVTRKRPQRPNRKRKGSNNNSNRTPGRCQRWQRVKTLGEHQGKCPEKFSERLPPRHTIRWGLVMPGDNDIDASTIKCSLVHSERKQNAGRPPRKMPRRILGAAPTPTTNHTSGDWSRQETTTPTRARSTAAWSTGKPSKTRGEGRGERPENSRSAYPRQEPYVGG